MSHTNHTQRRIDSIIRTKGQVLHRHEMEEDYWVDLMLDTGRRFAQSFSRHYMHDKHVFNQLIGTPLFWVWWRVKWLMDDEAYIKSSAYYSAIPYEEIKNAMVGEDILEAQLLNILDNKKRKK